MTPGCVVTRPRVPFQVGGPASSPPNGRLDRTSLSRRCSHCPLRVRLSPARGGTATVMPRPVNPVRDPGQVPGADGLRSRLAELERDLAVVRARREAAESVAAVHEQRAKNAERALLMIEALTPRHESAAPLAVEHPDEVVPAPDDPVPPRRRWWSRRT